MTGSGDRPGVGDTRSHYSESPCASALTPWLWNYWEFRVEADAAETLTHHIPPDGCTSIAVIFESGTVRDIVASGPWLDPFSVPATSRNYYLGVRCRPEAGGLLLGTSPDHLRNKAQPVWTLVPKLAADLAAALVSAPALDQAAMELDRVLATHLRGTSPPDPVCRNAVDLLVTSRGELAIGRLAGETGVSSRTLLRRFRAATGLTPKQFARICRFRNAAMTLVHNDRPDWAQVASGTGFADQAHMINEFKDLTGLTPEGLGERIRRTSHGDLIA